MSNFYDVMFRGFETQSPIEIMATDHWMYTKSLIELSMSMGVSSGLDERRFSWDEIVDLCKYLYVNAMVHGYKHGENDSVIWDEAFVTSHVQRALESVEKGDMASASAVLLSLRSYMENVVARRSMKMVEETLDSLNNEETPGKQ